METGMTQEAIERFRELRQREADGLLCAEERSELASMIREMDQREAKQLSAATARARDQRRSVESQNQKLSELIQRKEALVLRMKEMLSEVEAERRSIRDEETRILAGASAVSSTSSR